MRILPLGSKIGRKLSTAGIRSSIHAVNPGRGLAMKITRTDFAIPHLSVTKGN
jgi:hypothetical protein